MRANPLIKQQPTPLYKERAKRKSKKHLFGLVSYYGVSVIIVIHSCNLLSTYTSKIRRDRRKMEKKNKHYVVQSALRKLKIVLLLVILTGWRLCQEVKVERVHAGVPRVRGRFCTIS